MTMTTTLTTEERLKELMLRRAMSPPDLGRAVGVSSQAVRNWLTGTVPNVKRAVAVAKHFNEPDLLRSWGYGPTADAMEAGEL